MQILVLDDSSFARGLIVRELKSMGFDDSNIQQAASGAVALDKIKSQQFDLFILDIIMSGIDGIAVLKEVKTLQPQAKVIMCSSHSSQTGIKELIDMGINDFLVKPVPADEFKKVVLRNLEMAE